MISSEAVVESNQISNSASIGEFTVIRKNVIIGEDVIIHPGVVIYEGVIIEPGTEVFPGTCIGKRPNGAGVTSRPISYQPLVRVGSYCAIGPNAVIYADVIIGNNTLIGDGASIRENCRIGSNCIIGRQVTINYQTEVMDYTKIMDHCWLAGNMKVGRHVFISGGVLTTNDNSMGKEDYLESDIRGPLIEDWARVGAGAILLPGVCIGEHAIVAAGAVVTKDVAPHELVMGLPARIARKQTEE